MTIEKQTEKHCHCSQTGLQKKTIF